MKKLILILSFLAITACDPAPSVKPGYILTGIRPLNLKADPVEAVPGDTVVFSLFLGGRDFSQDSDLPVKWFGTEALTLPYGQPLLFKIPENIEEFLTNPEIPSYVSESFEKNGFADLPVIASFEEPLEYGPEFRTVTLTKTLRIYKFLPESGVSVNPVISHIEAVYLINGSVQTIEIKNSDNISFSLKEMPNTIGFKSVPDEATGYDRINYRWYYTSDTGSLLNEDIDIKEDLSDLEDFVPEDEKVTPNRQYFGADFTRILEEIRTGNKKLPVTFNFYNVIRDRATAAESSADYRWGSDHMWFTIEITE